MALVINTNLSSLRAQLNLNKTQSSLSTSLERISSGSKINSPRDDAAGLAISQRLTAQISSLRKAIGNAGDAVSFVQSADSALEGVSASLLEIQSLAVQASKASQSPTDRGLLNNYVLTKKQEINRLAEEAEFNGKKMLTGKIVNAEFQVGLRSEQVIRLSIPLVSAFNIGNYSTTTDNTREFAIGAARQGELQGEAPINFVQAQSITIRGVSSGPSGAIVGIREGESAKSIAEKVNSVEAQTGVTAAATTYVTLENLFGADVGGEGQKISFQLYGLNAKVFGDQGGDDQVSNAVSISAQITDDTEDGLRDLVSAINDQVGVTGIRARVVGIRDEETGLDVGAIALENGGVNISIEKFRNDRIPGAGEDPASIQPDKTDITVRGINGSEFVVLEENSDTDSVTVGGVVKFNSFKAFTVTSDAEESTSLFFSGSAESGSQTSNFTSLSSVSLSTEETTKEALLIATSALDFISSLRADLGAIQNRFVSAVTNLESVVENTRTAQSRILDADFAEETAQLTRAQVLQQAGIAILAQANTIPQAVLALLRT
ncbi:MAG: flagellin [Nitrospirota bacterium]